MNLDDALNRILRDMDSYVEHEHGIDWVRNPSNALENFADKWIEYPKRRDNFYNWLQTVRADVDRITDAESDERAIILTEAFGDETAARVARQQQQPRTWEKRRSIFAAHRTAPPWTPRDAGYVKIKKATWAHKGSIRTHPFSSDSKAVPKNVILRFYASTDIPQPYEVYWQIVNTGDEAVRANCLRGTFEVGSVHSGSLIRKEPTAYKGTHTVECFIVKEGYLAARSGQFIVNIE